MHSPTALAPTDDAPQPDLRGEAGPRAYGRGADSEPAIATVVAIYEAFAVRDLEQVIRLTAPDVELMPHGTASLVGRTEPYLGHTGMREYFADAERVWEDLRITAEDFRAAGTGVVVFGAVEGTSAGRRLRRRAVWVWQVRDGLATSMRVTDLGDAHDAA